MKCCKNLLIIICCKDLLISILKFFEKIDLINYVLMVLCFFEVFCKILYRRGVFFFVVDCCLKSI